MSALSRADNSLLGRWWWSVDRWTLGAIGMLIGFERESQPVLEARLAPGDWLYLPAGWWHAATAQEASISLSIGLMIPTAIDVLDELRTQLLSSLYWRQKLPLAGTASGLSREEIRERTRAAFVDLGKDLAQTLATSEKLVRAFVPDPS